MNRTKYKFYCNRLLLDGEYKGEVIPFGDLNFDKVIDRKYRYMEFPESYFNIEENCVIPVMGTYVEELFEIKKKTALKAT